MHFSRFNWVSELTTSGQKLLLNFQSRSADLIEAGDAPLFLGSARTVPADELGPIVERGYAFTVPAGEQELLDSLREWERFHTPPVFVLHFGAPRVGKWALAEIADRLLGTPVQADVEGEILLFGQTLATPLPSSSELLEFAMRCVRPQMSGTIVASKETLEFFDPLLESEFVQSVVVVWSLSDGVMAGNTASKVDEILNSGRSVVVELRMDASDIDGLPQFVNALIREAWPMRDRFRCRLAPKGGVGCMLGRLYPVQVELARRVFEIFSSRPQTQFCSLEDWVGVGCVHALVWRGKLPPPSLHFCQASRNLTVLTGDGRTFACPKMAERPEAPRSAFTLSDTLRLAGCQACRYLPACGGGCRFAAVQQNGGSRCCPPVTDLLETAAAGWMDELLAKAAYIENREAASA